MRVLYILIFLSLTIYRLPARTGEASEQVKTTTDKIIAILKDPKLQGDTLQTERRRLLRQEIDQRFDWPNIARGCLGRHWPKLNQTQRDQFLDLFRQFLEGNYLDQIEPFYAELDRIEYQGEKIIDNYASVKTVVRTKKNIEHPVEYRLEKSSAGQWRIYDAVIEGVSLVKNYRMQFDEILTRSSFETLLTDLKARIK